MSRWLRTVVERIREAIREAEANGEKAGIMRIPADLWPQFVAEMENLCGMCDPLREGLGFQAEYGIDGWRVVKMRCPVCNTECSTLWSASIIMCCTACKERFEQLRKESPLGRLVDEYVNEKER